MFDRCRISLESIDRCIARMEDETPTKDLPDNKKDWIIDIEPMVTTAKGHLTELSTAQKYNLDIKG